jgi:hypothetical protein
MGRRGKSSIMPRPNRNKIGTTGKVPRSPAKKGRDLGSQSYVRLTLT